MRIFIIIIVIRTFKYVMFLCRYVNILILDCTHFNNIYKHTVKHKQYKLDAYYYYSS